jgi:hypothetical protein
LSEGFQPGGFSEQAELDVEATEDSRTMHGADFLEKPNAAQ